MGSMVSGSVAYPEKPNALGPSLSPLSQSTSQQADGSEDHQGGKDEQRTEHGYL